MNMSNYMNTYCCVALSMVHVQIHAACPDPCRMSMSMLQGQAACTVRTCPCCMLMSMLYGHELGQEACTYISCCMPCPFFMSMSKLHVHVHAECPCLCSILKSMQHGHGHAAGTWTCRTWTCSKDMQQGHGHAAWTWTRSKDMDTQHILGHAACFGLFCCILVCLTLFPVIRLFWPCWP
jgi:hypothetical protein